MSYIHRCPMGLSPFVSRPYFSVFASFSLGIHLSISFYSRIPLCCCRFYQLCSRYSLFLYFVKALLLKYMYARAHVCWCLSTYISVLGLKMNNNIFTKMCLKHYNFVFLFLYRSPGKHCRYVDSLHTYTKGSIIQNFFSNVCIDDLEQLYRLKSFKIIL